MRLEQGDIYDVGVDVVSLRGGTTFLVASTLVGAENLGHALAALRTQWQRWSRSGFDAAEISVARWRHAATLPFRNASRDALAYQVLRPVERGGARGRRERAEPVRRRGRAARRRA
jgi:hypothetical protein